MWNTADTLNHAYGHLIKLLLWTGQRRGEIAELRRSFINYTDKTCTLPSSLTKNGLEHVFVIGDDTIAFLKSLQGATDLFFPAKDSTTKAINGWGKWKIAFDKKIQPPIPHFTLHDARRTFASTFPADPWVIEFHLNHQSGHMTPIAKTYNRRKYLGEAASAMQKYEGQLRHIVTVLHGAA